MLAYDFASRKPDVSKKIRPTGSWFDSSDIPFGSVNRAEAIFAMQLIM